jgi:hypothetical protein
LVQQFVRGLSFEPELSFFEDDQDSGEDELERELDAEIDRAGEPHVRVDRPRRQAHEERLTREQKQKVNLVHVNLGHLSRQQMLSLFKAAGGREAVMKFIKEEFNCEHCMRQRKPID